MQVYPSRNIDCHNMLTEKEHALQMFLKHPYAHPLLNSPIVTATFSYKRETNRLQWGIQCNGRHPNENSRKLATSTNILQKQLQTN